MPISQGFYLRSRGGFTFTLENQSIQQVCICVSSKCRSLLLRITYLKTCNGLFDCVFVCVAAGKEQELRDKEKAQQLYLQVKSEVEQCIAYLKVKRESDPYRNLLPRILYQASHGFSSEIPTFDL